MDTDERLNEERIAALEQRLTALESRAEGCITQDEYRARLASLRAPGVEIPSEPVDVAEMQAQIHEADMDRIAASERLNAANAALATARRERDEAVGVVRDWLGWRTGDEGISFGSVVDRARALVAGEAEPDPDEPIATDLAKRLSMWEAERLAGAALSGPAAPDSVPIKTLRDMLTLQYDLDAATSELAQASEVLDAMGVLPLGGGVHLRLIDLKHADVVSGEHTERLLEIATLRTSLAEARGEVARLNKTVAERNGHIRAQCALMDEWRNGRNAAEADRDALRTRLDEAMGIMRAVEALGTCRRPCSHPVCLVITRARFLVAGQTGLPADALCCCGHALAAHQGHTVVAGQPEPTHCAECRSCRSFAEAPKRETIAALRTQLAERDAEELERHQALCAQLAEAEADREALRTRLDAAGKLIERAVPVCEDAAECQHDGPGLCWECGLAVKAVAADLRAYLGGGT